MEAAQAVTRLLVGPFNRVEGDLEIALDIADRRVESARVAAPLYRGFEHILEGRPPGDALVIAPRICGICSISHSVAASRALAAAAGIEPEENGRRATDLVLAAENVADHLTHFALFFMPDFARPVYSGRLWHGEAVARFRATAGGASARLVAARARFLHLVGALAGKWPHSLAIQPGGTTASIDLGGRVRLSGILSEFRQVLETHLFGAALERVAALDGPEGLAPWLGDGPESRSDFGLFLTISRDLDLAGLGRWDGPLMSFGAFDGLFPAGLWADGPQALDMGAIAEDLSHAWMAGETRHPARGITRPDADKAGAYSWCKAPRLSGRPVEVGALARQMMAGQPLVRALAAGGSGVEARVVARLVEIARLVLAMEGWVRDLRPGQPFCRDMPPLTDTDGAVAGLVEAARGGLGHWLTIRRGRIHRYQIVAPTTWNFSPRDAAGVPGPLEQALVGTPAGDAPDPVAVQHVVRSFDPCMACTVH